MGARGAAARPRCALPALPTARPARLVPVGPRLGPGRRSAPPRSRPPEPPSPFARSPALPGPSARRAAALGMCPHMSGARPCLLRRRAFQCARPALRSPPIRSPPVRSPPVRSPAHPARPGAGRGHPAGSGRGAGRQEPEAPQPPLQGEEEAPSLHWDLGRPLTGLRSAHLDLGLGEPGLAAGACCLSPQVQSTVAHPHPQLKAALSLPPAELPVDSTFVLAVEHLDPAPGNCTPGNTALGAALALSCWGLAGSWTHSLSSSGPDRRGTAAQNTPTCQLPTFRRHLLRPPANLVAPIKSPPEQDTSPPPREQDTAPHPESRTQPPTPRAGHSPPPRDQDRSPPPREQDTAPTPRAGQETPTPRAGHSPPPRDQDRRPPPPEQDTAPTPRPGQETPTPRAGHSPHPESRTQPPPPEQDTVPHPESRTGDPHPQSRTQPPPREQDTVPHPETRTGAPHPETRTQSPTPRPGQETPTPRAGHSPPPPREEDTSPPPPEQEMALPLPGQDRRWLCSDSFIDRVQGQLEHSPRCSPWSRQRHVASPSVPGVSGPGPAPSSCCSGPGAWKGWAVWPEGEGPRKRVGAGVQVKAGRMCLPPHLQVKPGILSMGPGLGCADGCSLTPLPPAASGPRLGRDVPSGLGGHEVRGVSSGPCHTEARAQGGQTTS
ncbi:uncharacterized protein [Muntiacus reevesi]|uniref:uncharacterized protein n=1 Tax=Muntiacus reevesi TaxID=9886 RepID=UPI0033078CDD